MALERCNGQTRREQPARPTAEDFPWTPGRPWQEHPPGYRAAELRTLLRWVAVGASGSLIGLPGVGRSDLLGYLCHRPEVVRAYLPPSAPHILFVPVDLNNLPDPTLATFYRVLLRAFYEVRTHFPADLEQLTARLLHENRSATDAFLPQSAVRELLLYVQSHSWRLVLVIDRFDAFCRMITPELGDTLVGLIDSFRDTLSYIVGVRLSLAYLDTLELASDFMRLLTTHTLYLGPLAEADAHHLIEQRTKVSGAVPTEPEVTEMLTLTGGYPTLLKAVCRWWLFTPECPPVREWPSILAAEPAIQRRLQDIWQGLTQEEQQALSELESGPAHQYNPASHRQQRWEAVLHSLAGRGVCRWQGVRWVFFGRLFADYVQRMGHASRGAIWIDPQSQAIFHGHALLDNLTPKEHAVLEFLLRNPRIRHTYTDVIMSAWSDEERYYGVTNDSLFQVIRGLRQRIEPNPAEPVYVVNWRGKPEGGYLFFPEGRPN